MVRVRLITAAATLALLAPKGSRALPMDFGGWSPGPWTCEMDQAMASDPRLAAKQAEFLALCARDAECWHLKRYRPGTSELAELRDHGTASRRLKCAPFEEPSPVLVGYLKRFAVDFHDAAELYEVSEDALIGQILATLQGHTNWVRSAAFSPDGAKIVTASRDNTARLWDLELYLSEGLAAEQGGTTP